METKRFPLSVNRTGNWQADSIISIESKETRITESRDASVWFKTHFTHSTATMGLIQGDRQRHRDRPTGGRPIHFWKCAKGAGYGTDTSVTQLLWRLRQRNHWKLGVSMNYYSKFKASMSYTVSLTLASIWSPLLIFKSTYTCVHTHTYISTFF